MCFQHDLHEIMHPPQYVTNLRVRDVRERWDLDGQDMQAGLRSMVGHLLTSEFVAFRGSAQPA